MRKNPTNNYRQLKISLNLQRLYKSSQLFRPNSIDIRPISCTTSTVIKEPLNSGHGGRLSPRLPLRFCIGVCRIIANGCISGPSALFDTCRPVCPLSRNCFTSNLVVSIIRNNIFFLYKFLAL